MGEWNRRQRNLLTSVVQPFDTGRTLTTKMTYDPVGNLKQTISPRAYDDSADKVNFPNYVTTYQYDNVNQLIRIDLPVGPAPDTTPLYGNCSEANGCATPATSPTPSNGLLDLIRGFYSSGVGQAGQDLASGVVSQAASYV